MKPAVKLFIFLLCTLFTGSGNAYAGNPVSTDYSTKSFHVLPIPEMDATANAVFPLIKADADPGQDDDITCVEEDDQDDVTRHDAPIRYFANSYHYLSINNRGFIFISAAPACKTPVYPTACIYLVQRSLRI